MRIFLLLFALVLLAGCDQSSSKPQVRNLSVDYRVDRKFNWNAEVKTLAGTLLIKAESGEKPVNYSFNAYGVTFELAPGERTTIIVKSDSEGVYFNGEYPDLPVRLPQLLDAHKGSFSELFDYDVRAICELELTLEPHNGNYILFINCFDVPASWYYSTEYTIPLQTSLTDDTYEALAEGRQRFKRTF